MRQTNLDHCPQTGKIYVVIISCLLLSCILTCVNIFSRKEPNQDQIDDSLFGTGIAINIIQTIFTLYLLYIDIGGSCDRGIVGQKTCDNYSCKWVNIAPPDISKRKISELLYGYLYVFIILLSSSYLLSFGIMMIMKSTDYNDENSITTLSIASGISGAIGILLIAIDLLCMLGCWCP
jgi:hypothetical protein